jgi:DNA-binding FadR family transcriptional regulator
MSSLTDKVVSFLSDDIRVGTYRAGEKLPTETGLIQKFGVSRSVIREAVSRLQASNLVETRHGIGTFVRATPDSGSITVMLPAVSNMQDAMAILEFRIDLEAAAAALAAARRSEADLLRLQGALKRFEDELERGSTDVLAHDVEFHLRIAQASDNRYYHDVQRQLGRSISPRTRLGGEDLARLDQLPRLHEVLNEHAAIYKAIARGDSDDARAAMRIHLSNSRERLKDAHKSGAHQDLRAAFMERERDVRQQ